MKDRCIACNAIDKEGLIIGLCNDCYDIYLDIGKIGKEVEKKHSKDMKELENRRLINGYYG